jgi:TIR domain
MSNDVFISYSHEDKKWLDRLQKMLKPLLRNHPISVWDDTKIRPGAKWKEEIEQALSNANAAVFLVSPHFLASDFITDKEVPKLLESAQKKGLRILWVLLSDCLWNETEIASYQALHSPASPLDSLEESEVNTALVAVCKEIKRTLAPSGPNDLLDSTKNKNRDPIVPPPPTPPTPPPIAQMDGTWRNADGSFTVIRQNGAMIAAESFVNVFGINTKAAWGQGMVVGRQAYIDFMDFYGNGGRTEVTLSDDGRSIAGVARYHNGFMQNIFASRSA